MEQVPSTGSSNSPSNAVTQESKTTHPIFYDCKMNELQPLPHYVKTSSKGKHEEKFKTVTIRRLWKHNQAKRHKSHKNESVQNFITTLRVLEERFRTKTNGPLQGSKYRLFSFCQLAFGSYRAPKTSYQANETRFDARKRFEVTNLQCRLNYDLRKLS